MGVIAATIIMTGTVCAPGLQTDLAGDCWAELQVEAERLTALYELPAGLLQAIMWLEARGDPWALGASGDFGPMQIIPSTAQGIAEQAGIPAELIMSNPVANLQAGAWFLDSLLARFRGDVDKALAVYNGGFTAVLECDCVPAHLAGYVDGVRWTWGRPALWRPVPVVAFPMVGATPDQWFGAMPGAAALPAVPQCFAVTARELSR